MKSEATEEPQESADAKVAALRALQVSCPYCNKPPGHDCQSANLWTVWPPHKSRIKIAHEVHTSPTGLDGDMSNSMDSERRLGESTSERASADRSERKVGGAVGAPNPYCGRTSPAALDADEEFRVAHERVIHNEIAERERRKAR